MRPKNDSARFAAPQRDTEIEQEVFDYYMRNTHVRSVDTDEDPRIDTLNPLMKQQNERLLSSNSFTDQRADEVIVKDIQSIHVCSDHQRAYVWMLTWPAGVGSGTASRQKRSLWLQVYSMASAWASHTTLTTD